MIQQYRNSYKSFRVFRDKKKPKFVCLSYMCIYCNIDNQFSVGLIKVLSHKSYTKHKLYIRTQKCQGDSFYKCESGVNNSAKWWVWVYNKVNE